MTRILDGVNAPSDLKGLDFSQLQQLSTELRETLVSTVTNNGGHLASSLGAVELTVALHYVFDSPRDKVVWDVGHQCYAHKILTGRKERFSTLRQHGGLSGFADPGESAHDAFVSGHASNSISAALGIARARDLKREDFSVIAVIGDGAINGGMAFEGLNQAGQLKTGLIVILNDNGMAISPTVGALSRWFQKARSGKAYRRAKVEAAEIVPRLPFGKKAWRVAARIKESLKSLFVPAMMLEELGFTYLGPVNGHSIADLVQAFRQAATYRGRPVCVHVVTTKGKGYDLAENDAVKFHGLSPNGKPVKVAPSYSEVFGRTALKLARSDTRIIGITAAMLDSTGLNLMAGEFPDRVFDVGICEQHAVTFAAGLASQGYIPIVAIYSTFLQRAFDQIIHDVCIPNLPVIFALDRAGIVGDDGKTHQGAFDLSYLSLIPNISICSPRNENELQHLLYWATTARQPVAIRYPRGSGCGVDMDKQFKEIVPGKAEVLQEGGDLLLLAIGSAVPTATRVSDLLEKKGVHSTVVDARFAKPLDCELIGRLAARTMRVATIEENTLIGGFGSHVGAFLQSQGIDGLRMRSFGLPDRFIEHGPREVLLASCQLDADGVCQGILAAFPELSRALV